MYLKLKIIADQKIKYYKTDFNYHDCLIIHRQKPFNFLWMVRKTGSFLITHKHEYHAQIIKNQINNNDHQAYYIFNNKIMKIDNDTLKNTYEKMKEFKK